MNVLFGDIKWNVFNEDVCIVCLLHLLSNSWDASIFVYNFIFLLTNMSVNKQNFSTWKLALVHFLLCCLSRFVFLEVDKTLNWTIWILLDVSRVYFTESTEHFVKFFFSCFIVQILYEQICVVVVLSASISWLMKSYLNFSAPNNLVIQSFNCSFCTFFLGVLHVRESFRSSVILYFKFTWRNVPIL